MKKLLLSALASVLRGLARGIIRKYQPKIVGVTGSVGKSSAKEAIYAAVKDSFKCRVSHGNFNNELGFPLTVIGDYERMGSGTFWLRVVVGGFRELFLGKEYPELLILEYGADKPGDIGYLTGIVRPDVAVVTSISKTPVHVENYDGPAGVVREKRRLIEAVKDGGVVILNADDEFVASMVEKTKGKTLTYGFGGSDVRITDFMNVSDEYRPVGVSFKLETLGKLLPVRIEGTFGRGQAYAAAVGLAVAEALGVNLIRASEKLSGYKALPGRMNVLKGAEGSWIIDDSYNASPLAMTEALNTLGSLKAKRKIAVLGDMKELGRFSEDAHKDIGKLVASACDVLLAVGEKGKVIAESAKASGMDERAVHIFDDSNDAKIVARDIINSGDLVLVKGSQSMRMERVTAEIMAEPEKAKELLVRQYGNWLS